MIAYIALHSNTNVSQSIILSTKDYFLFLNIIENFISHIYRNNKVLHTLTNEAFFVVAVALFLRSTTIFCFALSSVLSNSKI